VELNVGIEREEPRLRQRRNLRGVGDKCPVRESGRRPAPVRGPEAQPQSQTDAVESGWSVAGRTTPEWSARTPEHLCRSVGEMENEQRQGENEFVDEFVDEFVEFVEHALRLSVPEGPGICWPRHFPEPGFWGRQFLGRATYIDARPASEAAGPALYGGRKNSHQSSKCIIFGSTDGRNPNVYRPFLAPPVVGAADWRWPSARGAVCRDQRRVELKNRRSGPLTHFQPEVLRPDSPAGRARSS
jgi:hypothetical protein